MEQRNFANLWPGFRARSQQKLLQPAMETAQRQRPRCCSKVNLMRQEREKERERRVSVRYWSLLTEGAEPATIWLFYLTSPEHEATFAYVANTPVSPLASPRVTLNRPPYQPDTTRSLLISPRSLSSQTLFISPLSFFYFTLLIRLQVSLFISLPFHFYIPIPGF